MIVRKQPNSELILIGQTDHSRLVGQLAAHWGNEEFAAPQPYASMVRAAAFHDYGWLRYETSPLIHPETGEPYQFLQVPLDATQLAAYQWSLDWLAGIDRYAGLIINMHRTGLWKNRYGAITHPRGYNLRDLNPDVRRFIQHNEAWQERERESWDSGGLWTNYRLMQVWDLLGLYFCCQDPYDDTIEPVPASYSDKEGIRLTFKRRTSFCDWNCYRCLRFLRRFLAADGADGPHARFLLQSLVTNSARPIRVIRG